MVYDFKGIKEKHSEIVNWLKNEYMSIQTGKANIAILDRIKVDAHGSKVPLSQVGSLSIEDPKTLLLTLWDPSLIADVEKAIRDTDSNVSISVGENSIRIKMPELTGERREMLKKVILEKQESAKISLKQAREKVINDIKQNVQSEDERDLYKKELQKLTDDWNKEFLSIAKRKTEELDN